MIFSAIPPAKQEFPLGDDWAFAHGAIWFAQGLGIHYSKWASMPQLGQWLWSWPYLLPTDLPHVALRVSVIVLSWLGLVAFHDLMRQEDIPARLAAFAACVLALDPLMFVSSGTYMTDVPALSFGLLALSFYSRAMRGKNRAGLFAAAAMAVVAVVTRQTMLAVPVVASFLLLRNPEIRWKPIWLLSVFAPVAVGIYTAWWFSKRTDVLPMQPVFRVSEVPFRLFLALHMCGLVVLPLCLLVSRPRGWPFVRVSLVMVLAASYLYLFGEGLPYGGSFPYCVGMLSLSGTYSDGLVVGSRDVLVTPAISIVLTILGCLGAAYIVTSFVETIRSKRWLGMLSLFTLSQSVILLTIPVVMDRYLEVLFPGALLWVAARCSASFSGWLAGTAALIVSGLISVALFHDWCSWNSARWELGRQAIATGIIKPGDIEGGFEWNGWYACADPGQLQAPPAASHASGGRDPLTLPFTRLFFPEVSGRFALAFTQPADSMIVASQPYSTWLSVGKKEFLLVRRKP